jgi:hypothetical protein
MRTLALLLLMDLGLAAAPPMAAVPPALPYSQDATATPTYDARGTWRLSAVAGFSEPFHTRYKRDRKRLLRTPLTINDATAQFSNKTVMQHGPFTFARLGEQTYDTRSREFWFDFRTDPRSLQLPPVVTSVDLELGQLVFAGGRRVLLHYEGTWYEAERAGR